VTRAKTLDAALAKVVDEARTYARWSGAAAASDYVLEIRHIRLISGAIRYDLCEPHERWTADYR
jgi:hypothetical protein